MNRSERRRQLHADRKLVEGGLDPSKRDPEQLAALMRVLYDLAEDSIAAGSTAPLMDYLYANMQTSSRHVRDIPVACKKGCAYCCTVWVAASAPEVIHAVRGIPKPLHEETVSRIEAANAVTRDLGFEQRAGTQIHCPMLKDSACGIYAARPIVCRTAVSPDAALCQRVFARLSEEQIPAPLPYHALGRGYILAFAGALKKAGLAYAPAEYNAALQLVCSAPQAEQSWLAGEDIFAKLPREPGGDLFDEPHYAEIYAAAF